MIAERSSSARVACGGRIPRARAGTPRPARSLRATPSRRRRRRDRPRAGRGRSPSVPRAVAPRFGERARTSPRPARSPPAARSALSIARPFKSSTGPGVGRLRRNPAPRVSCGGPELESIHDRGGRLMQQMNVYGVSFDLVGKQPIVLLKTVDGNRFLPIWIGHPEAAAILMKLQNAATPRPMTHDLVTDILGELGARVIQVAVTELRENTFYAQVTVQQDGSEYEVDSRPSDAIALAVRAEAPIFVADDVIDESAIEFEGEEISDEALEKEVTKFRSFLENVTPDEFAAGEEPD